MSSRGAKYWHKTDEHSYEPLSVNLDGLNIEMQARDLEWCKDCQAAVTAESKLDATGLNNVCPFCGSDTMPRKPRTYRRR